MTELGAEAPVGPVLGGPRKSRERARIAAVGAIAVLVFGAGIGLAGNGFSNEPPASQPPPASSSPASPSSEPTDTAEVTLVPPTQNAGLGCAPVRLGAPPEIRVSSDAGNLAPVTGVAASPAPSPSAKPASWPVPDAPTAVRLSGPEQLLLAPDNDACVRYVIAEYRPADPSLKGPFPIAFRTLNVSPPRSVVTLGALPAGDWVVRIVTYFSTGVLGQEDANVVERFFRVISGAGGGPLPFPESPPAVPCVPLAAGAPGPELALYGADVEAVAGIPPGTGTPSLESAELGATIEIRSVGDVCARAWQITAHLVEDGQDYGLASQENPASDPFQFAQNRWLLAGVPSGLLQITAAMDYSLDVHVTRRWNLAMYVPELPPVRLLVPDVDEAFALPGCGTSWVFPSATSGSETCTGPAFAGEPDTITVKAGVPVELDVPGWQVTSWSATCGRFDAPNRASNPFLTVDNCDLGGSLVPGRIVFLPRASAPLVRIYLAIQQGEVSATGFVFVSVMTPP